MKKILLRAAVVLWMVLIFLMSAQNADRSSDLSGNLLQKMYSVSYPNWEQLSETAKQMRMDAVHDIFRKCGHFLEYAVLGILWTLNTRLGHWEKGCCKGKQSYRIWLPFVCSLIYAASDEFHQLFVEGRSGEIRDVCIDFGGACTGILLLYAVVAASRAIKQKRNKKNAVGA